MPSSPFNTPWGVIFDLDATLIDSEPNYLEADQRLYAEYGIHEFTAEMKKQYIGRSAMDLIVDLKANHSIEDSLDDLLDKKNAYYLDIARANTQVFPEMRKFLGLLQERNHPLAVASGSAPDVIEALLEVTDIRSYFRTCVSSRELPKGKPAPDIFLLAAAQLGIAPERCLVIEDSQYGVEAARAAGMRCVAIPYLLDEPLPDSYGEADLLIREGMNFFSAERTLEWMRTCGMTP